VGDGTIRGSQEAALAMLAMIQSGKLTPGGLVGRTISLEESMEALTSMDRFEGAGATVVTEF